MTLRYLLAFALTGLLLAACGDDEPPYQEPVSVYIYHLYAGQNGQVSIKNHSGIVQDISDWYIHYTNGYNCYSGCYFTIPDSTVLQIQETRTWYTGFEITDTGTYTAILYDELGNRIHTLEY